jgi:hypothetical protein
VVNKDEEQCPKAWVDTTLHPYSKAVISLKQDAVTLCEISSQRVSNRDTANFDFVKNSQAQSFSRILRATAWVETFPTLSLA